MKTFLSLITIFLLGITNQINSQEINPLDFFPHHVGDLWQYNNLTQVGSEFWEKKVTAVDTVESDSAIIITVNYRNSFDILHKIYFNDSLTIYWESWGGGIWKPRYKFNVPINSFWLSDPFFPYYTKYVSEYESVIFNDTLLVKEYWTSNDSVFQLALSTENLALGIGDFYGEFEVGITVLTGCIIDGVQYGTIVDVADENKKSQPGNFILNNYPNPFNGQTTVHYFLPVLSFISVTIYDILGKEIKQLYQGEENAGHHYKSWTPGNESSGIYFVVLKTKETQLTNKIIYLK